jgi:hypothetical protein
MGYSMVPGIETTDLSIDIEALVKHSSSHIRAVVASSNTTPAEVIRSFWRPFQSILIGALD